MLATVPPRAGWASVDDSSLAISARGLDGNAVPVRRSGGQQRYVFLSFIVCCLVQRRGAAADVHFLIHRSNDDFFDRRADEAGSADQRYPNRHAARIGIRLA